MCYSITQEVERIAGALALTAGQRHECWVKRLMAKHFPGITALDTSGHSPGHVSLMLRSGAEALLIGGDVLIEPVISFARPAWPWGPDWNGDRAIKARLSTLDMLATDKIRLLGYHLPWPGVGRVERLATAAPSYRFVAG